jgi:ribosomal protein L11 methylase PrmA
MEQLFQIPFFRKYTRKAYYTYTKWEQAYIGNLLSPEKIVLAGIFKGLQYPGFESSGSGLVTKLLGSYEDELHPFIQQLSSNNYSEIIDIGCAEGYYAIGLAKMFPKATINAFDIDKEALDRCRKMGELNGVQFRMILKDRCDKNVLRNMLIRERGFILCDCEGHESDLFDEEIAAGLKNCDLIIELHDHIVPNIKMKIERAFRNTHHINYVVSRLKSINDYPLMQKLPAEYQQDRYLIDRDRRMEWACITPA